MTNKDIQQAMINKLNSWSRDGHKATAVTVDGNYIGAKITADDQEKFDSVILVCDNNGYIYCLCCSGFSRVTTNSWPISDFIS